MKEMRVDLKSFSGGSETDDKSVIHAKKIGIEKHGDDFSVFVSVKEEPMHQYGKAVRLPISGPFYVGIGFCSHLPDKVDAGVLSNVTLVNEAGQVK